MAKSSLHLFCSIGNRFRSSVKFGTLSKPFIRYVSAKTAQNLQKTPKDSVGSSTIVIQDGINFRELPLVVKNTKILNVSDGQECIEKNEDTTHKFLSSSLEIENMKEILNRCIKLDELFEFLENVPSDQVTPLVAAYALKCIANLHVNAEFRNEGRMQNGMDTFARNAVVSRLIEMVCDSEEMDVVLDGLRGAVRMSLVTIVGDANNNNNNNNNNLLLDKFVDECLLRISDGKANLTQICDFASLVVSAKCDDRASVLDKLWSALSDKVNEIDAGVLVKLYRLLPSLKHSRPVVFRMLEKRTYNCWWQLNIADVVEIVDVLVKLKFLPQKLLISLSRWMNTHVHTLRENDLIRLIRAFEELNFIDQNIIRAIERYVKAKNVSIEDPALVAQIMSFCSTFRLQSDIILNSVARYFLAHASQLPAKHIATIVKPFGALNFVPNGELEFYKTLEEVLMTKFVQFRPDELVELLLTCTYVQRFPLNFVRKVFNPYFLQRLNSIQGKLDLHRAHSILRLLDMAMTIECRRYRGPLLPRDSSAYVLQRDGRLIKMINKLSDTLIELCGSSNYFWSNKWLHQYPLSEMYIIDLIVHFNRDGKIMPVDEKSKIGKRKAVIIHTTDHYCRNSKCLIGEQVAKMRILQKLGYEVLNIDYDELLIMYNKNLLLADYLKRNLLDH